MSKAKRPKEHLDIATQKFQEGYQTVQGYPLFSPLWQKADVVRRKENDTYPADGLCFVTSDGYILCNPKRRAEPGQWARALAHCLLHLGMEHFKEKEQPILWNMACDCVIEKNLIDLKFGSPLHDGLLPAGISDEERLSHLQNPHLGEQVSLTSVVFFSVNRYFLPVVPLANSLKEGMREFGEQRTG